MNDFEMDKKEAEIFMRKHLADAFVICLIVPFFTHCLERPLVRRDLNGIYDFLIEDGWHVTDDKEKWIKYIASQVPDKIDLHSSIWKYIDIPSEIEENLTLLGFEIEHVTIDSFLDLMNEAKTSPESSEKRSMLQKIERWKRYITAGLVK